MPRDGAALQILANYCAATAEAMAYTLMRTAHSTFVKETEDFSCGLLTPEGMTFASPKTLEVKGEDGKTQVISFDHAIIAVGSEPITLPFIPHGDPRVLDSTSALALVAIPKRLLVLGGGIIGLEMATVYHALGSKVTVVEFMDQIMPGADKDMVTPLLKRIEKR